MAFFGAKRCFGLLNLKDTNELLRWYPVINLGIDFFERGWPANVCNRTKFK